MSAVKTNSSLAIAAAAAALFALAPVSASAGDKIHCNGVNACKGLSSCKTANSECKGKNSCKGQGFVAVTKEVCEQLGGKVG